MFELYMDFHNRQYLILELASGHIKYNVFELYLMFEDFKCKLLLLSEVYLKVLIDSNPNLIDTYTYTW